MTDYVRYYEDDSGAVEYTNYVDLKCISVSHEINRDIGIEMGNSGSNLYRDDVRYTQKWTIIAVVSRRVADTLRGWADNTFDSDTTLRVYNKYAADYYNNYTGVKMLSYKDFTSESEGLGEKYQITLVVVK